MPTLRAKLTKVTSNKHCGIWCNLAPANERLVCGYFSMLSFVSGYSAHNPCPKPTSVMSCICRSSVQVSGDHFLHVALQLRGNSCACNRSPCPAAQRKFVCVQLDKKTAIKWFEFQPYCLAYLSFGAYLQTRHWFIKGVLRLAWLRKKGTN